MGGVVRQPVVAPLPRDRNSSRAMDAQLNYATIREFVTNAIQAGACV